MVRHNRLCGQDITHSDLDNLGISVENLRKTRALTNTKSNRQRYYGIRQAISKGEENGFILKNRV